MDVELLAITPNAEKVIEMVGAGMAFDNYLNHS